jgi:hypothetical protein
VLFLHVLSVLGHITAWVHREGRNEAQDSLDFGMKLSSWFHAPAACPRGKKAPYLFKRSFYGFWLLRSFRKRQWRSNLSAPLQFWTKAVQSKCHTRACRADSHMAKYRNFTLSFYWKAEPSQVYYLTSQNWYKYQNKNVDCGDLFYTRVLNWFFAKYN